MTDGMDAPGPPGIPPRWTSSTKNGVGTALSPCSRVWFTLSHGIVNEVYYPRVDQACVRDLELLVSDRADFFSEEKRHTEHQIQYLAPDVPAFRLVNTCSRGRYRVEKQILTDPQRDVLLQHIHFVPLQGRLEDYECCVLLAPHLGNRGAGNTAWVGDHKGLTLLLAQRENSALALACSTPWLQCSAGYVGSSDGWQDLAHHKRMGWTYQQASSGNVALTGQVDLGASEGRFVLALGFGRNPAEAGHRVLASLLDGFELARSEYVQQWQGWQKALLDLDGPEPSAPDLCRVSTTVIRTHEAKRFPGGIIASLSIPWGADKGDDDLGGYHLVWPRDLVEAAGGLLAAGAHQDVLRVLDYLRVTQEADGHWPQNMWLDGTPYWTGVQMDETALPILLVDLARREGTLEASELGRYWPMIYQAAGFLIRNGPVTQQDRWEEDPGYSPFTLAVEIAALLAAADMAELHQEDRLAAYLRETADAWNDSIERWTYVTDTELAEQVGVDGYYVRIAPPDVAESASPAAGFVPIKNRPPGESSAPADHLVSPDALALVRFGLRTPDDPRIRDTLKVIDTLLKVETPHGPAWRRYNGDGYGEHKDGSSFDGAGVGRAWPLLTGERAHYELAAGRADEALRLSKALEAFANDGGMIPEQIWDAADIPERELFFGAPSGSAMPLVWAHAELIKLRRSLRDGRVFDMPCQTVQRYQQEKVRSPYAIWRPNHKCRTIQTGQILRVELLRPATVRWSMNNWSDHRDLDTLDAGLGMHLVDLRTETLPPGRAISFTFLWLDTGQWEGSDYGVEIGQWCQQNPRRW
jgi:glucoamylase